MGKSAAMGWIQSLLDPAAFPHATGELQLLETHISWVVLTGEFAYKIKKPIDFGFVNFSTLELREATCHDEVRLNRRWSEDIYLDVCLITGTPEAPSLGGDSEPFEFAVRMRQFQQRQLLSRCLTADRLQARHLEAFALELARFHQRVDGQPGPDLGTPEAVRHPVMHNFDPLLDAELPDADRALAVRLREFAVRWFDDHHNLLERRRADGFVRECHGDLHLENMLLVKGRIELFDCLEFNASLRWVDVMSEIAFLVMDLESRGRPDFARRFLNAYIEHSGDHEGLALLPFYVAYRAVVRAKVDQLRRNQPAEDPASRQALLRELEGYLDEAATYARQAQPRLTVMCGVSGTGKTRYSRQFIDAGFIRLRSDFERKRLAGSELDVPVQGDRSIPELPPPEVLYAAESTRRTYAELARRAEICLAAGFSVVIDATCLMATQRRLFVDLAQRLGTPFHLFLLEHAPAVLEQRIRGRQEKQQDLSDADIEVLRLQLAGRELLTSEELPTATIIDGRKEKPRSVIAAWLEQKPGSEC